VTDDPALIAAAGAGALALVALVVVILLAVRVARMRADQHALLPDGVREDLLARQADLARIVERVERQIADLDQLTTTQAETTRARLAVALRFRGLVRYDAYREMGGQQSWSIALLDEHETGAVITCLHARDHARVYLKEVVEGRATQRLSPEEERSLVEAVGAGAPPRPAPVPSADPESEVDAR